jgi:hypothetical protein
MQQQSETLRRALEALREVCGNPLTDQPTSCTPPASTAESSEVGATTGMAAHDPNEWRSEFELWLTSACVGLDGVCTGLGALHVAFAEWCVGHASVPCTRATLVHLLEDQGFETCNALVRTIVLRGDLRAINDAKGTSDLQAERRVPRPNGRG